MPTVNQRINQRTTREHTYCLINEMEPQFEVVEISADGFSFACDRTDNRFTVNLGLSDISIVNGESQEIIHAEGVVRHRSGFDARRDRIGVSFRCKRFDNTITGRVRLPRRRPSLRLGVSLKNGEKSVSGTVVDYNVRSARLRMDGAVSVKPGDVVRVSLGTGARMLYDGAASVVRSDDDTFQIVVDFLDNLLELRAVSVTEKAMFAGSIIKEKNEELAIYSVVDPEYKALLSDWHMYLEMVESVIDGEERKGIIESAEDGRRYLEEIYPEFSDQMRGYITRLNAIAPSIDPEHLASYKQFFRRRLDAFIRRSPLASSIMDKLHGYHGDFETVKQFFSDPFAGSTLFGKLMNRFIMSLEAVSAHVDRIDYVHDQILDRYQKSEKGIRVMSLGAGPAEEILRLIREQEFDRPVHVSLVDQDAYALADFYERSQPFQQPKLTIDLVNFNIVNILVGKTTDLLPKSYDITYCAGMFDYFKARLCRKFINFVIDLTKPGGHFIYTNVHSRNFARYFMDFGGGWEIYHRTEEETLALAPPDQNCQALTDDTGTNVFVKGTCPEAGTKSVPGHKTAATSPADTTTGAVAGT